MAHLFQVGAGMRWDAGSRRVAEMVAITRRHSLRAGRYKAHNVERHLVPRSAVA